ncbi:MAG: hypothetical protein IJA36_00025 [Lachnospiraceae bacterium]|nr:hypothetical protein [Lachnospiraceae bacterium]
MSTMEQHCIAAIQKGIKKICFTEHVDYNIAEYNVGKVNYLICLFDNLGSANIHWFSPLSYTFIL